MQDDEYECAKCKKVFMSSWVDVEGVAEHEVSSHYLKTSPPVLLCADCYAEVGAWWASLSHEQVKAMQDEFKKIK